MTPTRADEDQDAARSALMANKAVPLERILNRALREHPGRLLGVTLETENGALIYELRVLSPEGHVTEWYYDAATTEPVARPGAAHDPHPPDE